MSKINILVTWTALATGVLLANSAVAEDLTILRNAKIHVCGSREELGCTMTIATKPATPTQPIRYYFLDSRYPAMIEFLAKNSLLIDPVNGADLSIKEAIGVVVWETLSGATFLGDVQVFKALAIVP